MYPPFDDPVLGRVIWMEGQRGGEWRFRLMLNSGHSTAASVEPALSPGDAVWDEIRKHAFWLKENEDGVRWRVAVELFDLWKEKWYDKEETDIPLERLRDALSLVGVNFYEDRKPELVYDDRGHFDDRLITVVLNAEGEFAHGPELEW